MRPNIQYRLDKYNLSRKITDLFGCLEGVSMDYTGTNKKKMDLLVNFFQKVIPRDECGIRFAVRSKVQQKDIKKQSNYPSQKIY